MKEWSSWKEASRDLFAGGLSKEDAIEAMNVIRKNRGNYDRRIRCDVVDKWYFIFTKLLEYHNRDLLPVTVRHVYYLAAAAGLIPKTENGYNCIANSLADMRLKGRLIPFDWIEDTTRSPRVPSVWSSPREIVQAALKGYRKDYWEDQDQYVEIWLEKRTLSDALYKVTEKYQVRLMVCGGFSSISFDWAASEEIKRQQRNGKECHLYMLSDRDGSGVKLYDSAKDHLNKLDVRVPFTRIALTQEQIERHGIQTRAPTKDGDKALGGPIADLDAMPADLLRQWVDDAIRPHIDFDIWNISKEREKEEKKELQEALGDLF